MASKNNPRNRDKQRLLVLCPKCEKEMQIVKVVPGGMFYKCEKCQSYHPITPGCYQEFEHKWVGGK